MKSFIPAFFFCLLFVSPVQADETEVGSEKCVAIRADSAMLVGQFKNLFHKIYSCSEFKKKTGITLIDMVHKLVKTSEEGKKDSYRIYLRGSTYKDNEDVGYWEEKSEVLYTPEGSKLSFDDMKMLAKEVVTASFSKGGAPNAFGFYN